MIARIVILSVVAISLAGCATRLNPFNWFGGDREERVSVEEVVEVLDNRQLAGEVLSLQADALPGGAIINAIGLPPTQGYWEADLVETSREGGTLTMEFRIFPPLTQAAAGTQRSREVLAGRFMSTQDLDGIRTIVVQGQNNRRSIRR